MKGDWRTAMKKRIRSLPNKENALPSASRAGGSTLPFAATAYWLSLAGENYRSCRRNEQGVPLDPILAQALPSAAESLRRPCESEDPLREAEHSPLPRLVHQYPSRLLLRCTGECAVFCRFCFRRSLLPRERAFISEKQQESAARYLAGHPEIREVLISGGDPLSASTEKLAALFAKLREARPGVFLRLCTRAPVSLPERVDEELVAMLARCQPLRVVIHANHPAELSPLFKKKMAALLGAGISVRSQTVLLRGVNDSADTLENLFVGLARSGVDPYYLFQGDLAAGTAHFRVPLSRALAVYAELRARLSGLELPRFAVDAPAGGGKVFLPEGIVGREGGFWLLKTARGKIEKYPEEA